MITTVHRQPWRPGQFRLPTVAELADILRATCGPPPPDDQLEGPAGLHGIVALWQPLLRQPSPSTAPEHPLAALAATYLTGLRRLIAELEDAAPSLRRSAGYRALIEAEIAAVLERRQRWPLIPSAGRSIPAPYWREAARTIAVAIKVAYEDAALPAPSENHRAAAVAVILNSLGQEVEAGSVRDALSEQP